ncbi:MAG: peptide deformylase [Alphaproteobacteria bacterium]
MRALTLLTAPDPLLRRQSASVSMVDDGVRDLMDRLVETMHEEGGIGLAAPQAGILRRVIVTRVSLEDGGLGEVLRMANPEIIWRSEERAVHCEGCLSVPDLTADVERSAEVVVRYLDAGGEVREIKADRLFAACLQHESDHLDGILFFDRLGLVRRDMIIRRLRKQKRERETSEREVVL